MSSDNDLSPSGRLILGLVFVAAGVFPILAAFDIGPLRQKDIHGPPWLGAAAGAVFVMGGIAAMAGNKGRYAPVSSVMAFGIVAFFAAMASWIAFGPGPRECSVGFSGAFFGSTRTAAEFEA